MKLKLRSSMLVCGPSQSGKTVFVSKIIKHKNKMFDVIPKRIIWYYSVSKPNIKNVEFIKGLPNIEDIKQFDMIILDDLMEETKSTEITSLFTKYVHHFEIFVVLITQNLFHQHKNSRTQHLNTNYLVLFKSPRDVSSIRYLGQQIFPGKSQYLIDSYRDATIKPHSYLFLDFHQNTKESDRIKTGIIPGEKEITYINML